MSGDYNIGKKNSLEHIDFNRLASGIKKEDIAKDEKLKSIFEKLDIDGSGDLSREEIKTLRELIQAVNKNKDNTLSINEAKHIKFGDKELGKEQAKALFQLLSGIMETAKNVKSVSDGTNGDEVVTYSDGTVETKHKDGSKTFVKTDENGKTITTELNKDGKKTRETVNDKQNNKTIETKFDNNENMTEEIVCDENGTTVTEYENNGQLKKKETKTSKDENTQETIIYEDGNPIKKTVNNKQDNKQAEFVFKDNEWVLQKSVENGGAITTIYNGKKRTEKKQDGTTTTTTIYDGEVTESETIEELVDDNKRKVTETKYKDNRPEQTTITVDGKKQQVIKGNNTVNYTQVTLRSGEEITCITGVIVQNGESINALAKKFNCDANEIVEANLGCLKKQNGYYYFNVGQEINIPDMDVDTFIEVNSARKTAEATTADYEAYEQARLNKQKNLEAQEAAQKAADAAKAEQDAKNQATADEIAATLLVSYDKWGTDDADFNEAIGKITSPEILALVETKLTAKHPEFADDDTESPIEKVIHSEKNKKASRNLFKQMINNGAFTADKAADIIQKELATVLNGATSFGGITSVVEMIVNKDIYDKLETKIKEANSDLEPDNGSYIRALIGTDGFTQKEIDKLDSMLLKAGAYEDNDKHTQELISRMVDVKDRKNESLHKILDAITSETDIEKLQEYAIQKGYPSIDDMLQALTEGNPEEYIACNTLLYKGEKPIDIQVTEAIKMATKKKIHDLSALFKSQDPKFYEELSDRINETGYKSLKILYSDALMQTSGMDKIIIKSNAILSGHIEFDETEVAEHCKELIRLIESQKDMVRSDYINLAGESSNMADELTQKLISITEKFPNIKQQLVDYVNENINEHNVSDLVAVNRKDDYLTILNSAQYTVKESKYVDEDGNEITDTARCEQIKQVYTERLKGLKEYVAELEREFNKTRDAQGDISRGADAVSRATGFGTDSTDVKRKYQDAKNILAKFEAAIDGKLRDAKGNVIMPDKLALDVLNDLQATNGKYLTTIEYTKMAMIMAPIIAVSAASASVFVSGGAVLAKGLGLAAGATKVVTIGSGIVGGALGAGLTDRALSELEMNTSKTGDTQAGREQARNQALMNAGFVVLGGVAGSSTSVWASKIATHVSSKFAAGVLNFVSFNTAMATDIGIGAISEELMTGEVTVEGMTFVVVMSVTGHLIGYKPVEAGNKPVVMSEAALERKILGLSDKPVSKMSDIELIQEYENYPVGRDGELTQENSQRLAQISQKLNEKGIRKNGELVESEVERVRNQANPRPAEEPKLPKEQKSTSSDTQVNTEASSNNAENDVLAKLAKGPAGGKLGLEKQNALRKQIDDIITTNDENKIKKALEILNKNLKGTNGNRELYRELTQKLNKALDGQGHSVPVSEPEVPKAEEQAIPVEVHAEQVSVLSEGFDPNTLVIRKDGNSLGAGSVEQQIKNLMSKAKTKADYEALADRIKGIKSEEAKNGHQIKSNVEEKLNKALNDIDKKIKELPDIVLGDEPEVVVEEKPATEAEVADSEPIEAEVADSEPIEAEVADSEPIEAEVADSEPISADVKNNNVPEMPDISEMRNMKFDSYNEAVSFFRDRGFEVTELPKRIRWGEQISEYECKKGGQIYTFGVKSDGTVQMISVKNGVTGTSKNTSIESNSGENKTTESSADSPLYVQDGNEAKLNKQGYVKTGDGKYKKIDQMTEDELSAALKVNLNNEKVFSMLAERLEILSLSDEAKGLMSNIENADFSRKGLFRNTQNQQAIASKLMNSIKEKFEGNIISDDDAIILLQQLSNKMEKNKLNTQDISMLIEDIDAGNITPNRYANNKRNERMSNEAEGAKAPKETLDSAVDNVDLTDRLFTRHNNRVANAYEVLEQIKSNYAENDISLDEARQLVEKLKVKMEKNGLTKPGDLTHLDKYKASLDRRASGIEAEWSFSKDGLKYTVNTSMESWMGGGDLEATLKELFSQKFVNKIMSELNSHGRSVAYKDNYTYEITADKNGNATIQERISTPEEIKYAEDIRKRQSANDNADVPDYTGKSDNVKDYTTENLNETDIYTSGGQVHPDEIGVGQWWDGCGFHTLTDNVEVLDMRFSKFIGTNVAYNAKNNSSIIHIDGHQAVGSTRPYDLEIRINGKVSKADADALTKYLDENVPNLRNDNVDVAQLQQKVADFLNGKIESGAKAKPKTDGAQKSSEYIEVEVVDDGEVEVISVEAADEVKVEKNSSEQVEAEREQQIREEERRQKEAEDAEQQYLNDDLMANDIVFGSNFYDAFADIDNHSFGI